MTIMIRNCDACGQVHGGGRYEYQPWRTTELQQPRTELMTDSTPATQKAVAAARCMPDRYKAQPAPGRKLLPRPYMMVGLATQAG